MYKENHLIDKQKTYIHNFITSIKSLVQKLNSFSDRWSEKQSRQSIVVHEDTTSSLN